MSAPLRVMHVMEAMHQGGAESLILEHLRHAGPGVETWLAVLNRGGPALEQAQALGAHAFVLGKGGSRLAGLRALAARMREHRIDVVNGHNPTGGLYAVVAARLARAPVVFRTEHSLHYAGRHSRFYPMLEPWLTRMASRVICVCDAVRESHVARMRALADRFVTVHNGIDAAPPARNGAAVRAELGVAPDQPLVLTVGSLTRQKAQHDLIDAFADVAAAHPGARLAIAGEGPLEAALRERARGAGVEAAVRFLGSRLDVPDLLEACDVFTLSSVREGLSVTLLEAMRAGRASVATRIGGNGEAIEDGVTGTLVPAGAPAALGAALSALIADPARRAAFGAAARLRWQARFTAERMVRETEALYERERTRVGVRAA